MKSFKEYLIESKQTYEFKIKLAGDHEKCSEAIMQALSKFNTQSCSDVKRTPIQETQVDFPDHKNINVTTCSVITEYPATSHEVRDLIANELNISHDCVKVRNLKEEEEEELNHQHDEKSGETLLLKDYEKENNQALVGHKHAMKLLKELNKEKHRGEQYKGVNDKILAKKAPLEKGPAASSDNVNNISPIGSKSARGK